MLRSSKRRNIQIKVFFRFKKCFNIFRRKRIYLSSKSFWRLSRYNSWKNEKNSITGRKKITFWEEK